MNFIESFYYHVTGLVRIQKCADADGDMSRDQPGIL
jgi:hypothetical protein